MNPDACYRAMKARDARFDGMFFVGVSTTGVYCRPICPVKLPGRDRCAFYATAAAAERAGFRACFRCRPELAPGHEGLRSQAGSAAVVLRKIEAGFLDEHTVDELAMELGMTARHVRRVTAQATGVSPVQLAHTRRLAIAKRLLQDTRLSVSHVAFASGFGSIRRFNAVFRRQFGRAPSELRRSAEQRDSDHVVLRLDFRPPLDWDAVLSFFAQRAIPGVETVAAGAYTRAIRIDGAEGLIAVEPDPKRNALVARVPVSFASHVAPLITSLRRLFDLDAQPQAVCEAFEHDALLGPLVERQSGLRMPGCFDPFEAGVFAVLGQQISLAGARTLLGRLVTRFGRPLAVGDVSSPAPCMAFPTAAALSAVPVADLAAIGMPRSRAETLHLLAAAVAAGDIDLSGAVPAADVVRQLQALRGVGPWTAGYIALRALRAPDVFLASDLGVRKALGGVSPQAAATRAESWSPWRSYAMLHLWASLGPQQEQEAAQ